MKGFGSRNAAQLMTIFYTPVFVIRIVFVSPATGTQTEEKTLVLVIFLSTPTNKKSGLFLAHSWTHGHVRTVGGPPTSACLHQSVHGVFPSRLLLDEGGPGSHVALSP